MKFRVDNTAAAMINGDELKALRAEDKDTPAYRRINDTLTYFQDNIDLDKQMQTIIICKLRLWKIYLVLFINLFLLSYR